MRFSAHRPVLPYITWGLIWDPKTKGISKLDSKTNEIKESLRKSKLLQNIYLSQVYLFVNVYSSRTGKREDLWDACVKRPSVFKCLSAYVCLLA